MTTEGKTHIIHDRISKQREYDIRRWNHHMVAWRIDGSLKSMLYVCGTDKHLEYMGTDGLWKTATPDELESAANERSQQTRIRATPLRDDLPYFEVHIGRPGKEEMKRLHASDLSDMMRCADIESEVRVRLVACETDDVPLFFVPQYCGRIIRSISLDPLIDAERQAFGFIRLRSVRWDPENRHFRGIVHITKDHGHRVGYDMKIVDLLPEFESTRIVSR